MVGRIKFLTDHFPDLLPGSQAKAGILFLFLGF